MGVLRSPHVWSSVPWLWDAGTCGVLRYGRAGPDDSAPRAGCVLGGLSRSSHGGPEG